MRKVFYLAIDSVTPKTIKSMCVQDADWLDAIDIIGLARAFAFGENQNRQIYHPDVKPNV